MNVRSLFFAACCFAATASGMLLSGCTSDESKAQAALGEYQAATAAGDLGAARGALLKLVAAQDNNPDYWQELGKVQLELGSFSDAYYAFTRAYELDRTNADVIAQLVQLALFSGNGDTAQDFAEKLELLAPTHPVLKLANGYFALGRNNLDEADRLSTELLQSYPTDPSAKMLKAKVLLARNDPKAAIALLEGQVQLRPSDIGSLRALMVLHERYANWAGVAAIAARLAKLQPANEQVALTAVEAAFRANDIETGRQRSLQMMAPDAPPGRVGGVLDVWRERWRTPDALAEARRLSRSAVPEQRLAYAAYFNDMESPADAISLVGAKPQLPVTLSNTSLNAIVAGALARAGNRQEAKRILDEVLKVEPDHAYALRARINLLLAGGNAKAAIRDAQRLVTIEPQSAGNRRLLALTYARAGSPGEADRTLWEGFHAINADYDMYQALRSHVLRTNGLEAAKQVDEEFALQLDLDLRRNLT